MRVIFYTGKGGSGKSVISSATALKLSELGYETLVISSDPAHTISDAFETQIQYTPTKTGGSDKLWAIQVDPIKEANIAKVVEPIVGVPTPSKEVISEDIKLMEILGRLKNIIVDREVTSLRLIANPDAFSIQNLRRTHLLANLYDINVDLGIMNKVIPEKVSDSYFKEWKDAQEKYLAEAEAAFYPLPLKRLRLFQSEVKGLRLLSELGDELFGDEDPAKVYFEGKAIKVTESNYGLEVIVPLPLPFASKYKEVCEVERAGEDLSVVISTDVGEVRNFIPLPTIAHIMKLDRAKLLNDELHIYFIDEKGDERG